MSDYIIYAGGQLRHHGVKGQKWGVRRYQKKDGSLTPAGKKRYYDDIGMYTKEGREQRDANDRAIYEHALKIRAKISKSDEYKQAQSNLKKSLVENRENYTAARESWLNGTDFKKLDYYQFKDAAYDRWASTEAGKTEAQRAKTFRAVIEKQVRETIGDKAFDQPLPELNATSWSKSLGVDYVNRIFNSERYE